MSNAAEVQEMLLKHVQKWAIENGEAESDDLGDYEYWGSFLLDESYLDGPLETPEGIWKEIDQARDRDEPSTYYHIFELSKGDNSRYFRIEGYYDSWNGTEYEDMDLVEVVKKTRVEEYWDTP